MNRWLLSWLLLAVAGTASAADGPSKPNVVFILADDLGWADTAPYGSTFHDTPNLKRLAARGVRFTQAYAACPLCSPTRCSILTGLYPARVGITAPACHLPQVQLEKKLAPAAPGQKALIAVSLTRLKTEYVTLAEVAQGGRVRDRPLRQVAPRARPGYEPKDQGFDADVPHTPRPAGPGGGYLAPWRFVTDPAIQPEAGRAHRGLDVRPGGGVHRGPQGQAVLPELLGLLGPRAVERQGRTDRALQEVGRPQGRRSGTRSTRRWSRAWTTPSAGCSTRWTRPASPTARSSCSSRTTAGSRTRRTTRTRPGTTPSRPRATPRSGAARPRCTRAAPGCRASSPGRDGEAGHDPDALLSSVDFFPTLLEMCGVKPPAGQKFDGVSQVLDLLGRAGRGTRCTATSRTGRGPGRGEAGFYPGTYVRRGDWKLIRFYAANDDQTDRLELYDLKADVGETTNRAAEQPEVVKQLSGLMDRFLADTEAVVPKANPNYRPAGGCPKPQGVPAMTGSFSFLGPPGVGGCGRRPDRRRQPNVVVILADDYGYECAAVTGRKDQDPEPRPAGGRGPAVHPGVRPGGLLPTRRQIMTGRYYCGQGRPVRRVRLPGATFAHVLKAAGYPTPSASGTSAGGSGAERRRVRRLLSLADGRRHQGHGMPTQSSATASR